METLALVSSLLMACHQPGGKNSRSPGSNTALIAWGCTWVKNLGNFSRVSLVNEKTGTRLVLESKDWDDADLYDDGDEAVTEGGDDRFDAADWERESEEAWASLSDPVLT